MRLKHLFPIVSTFMTWLTISLVIQGDMRWIALLGPTLALWIISFIELREGRNEHKKNT